MLYSTLHTGAVLSISKETEALFPALSITSNVYSPSSSIESPREYSTFVPFLVNVTLSRFVSLTLGVTGVLYNFSSTPSITGAVVSTINTTDVSFPSVSLIVSVYVPSSEIVVLPLYVTVFPSESVIVAVN